MSNTLTPIDISTMPDLVRLVEEVEATNTPRELKRDKKIVAVLMPTTKKATPKNKQTKVRNEHEAFLAIAGAWKDVDTDKLLENIYADRKRSVIEPPIAL